MKKERKSTFKLLINIDIINEFEGENLRIYEVLLKSYTHNERTINNFIRDARKKFNLITHRDRNKFLYVEKQELIRVAKLQNELVYDNLKFLYSGKKLNNSTKLDTTQLREFGEEIINEYQAAKALRISITTLRHLNRTGWIHAKLTLTSYKGFYTAELIEDIKKYNSYKHHFSKEETGILYITHTSIDALEQYGSEELLTAQIAEITGLNIRAIGTLVKRKWLKIKKSCDLREYIWDKAYVIKALKVFVSLGNQRNRPNIKIKTVTEKRIIEQYKNLKEYRAETDNQFNIKIKENIILCDVYDNKVFFHSLNITPELKELVKIQNKLSADIPLLKKQLNSIYGKNISYV